MAVNNGLTVSKLNSRLAPGRYHDGRGTGLNVLVKKSGAKFWVQRYTVRGKRHDLGLGSYPNVSLADARQKAIQNKQILQDGGDPKLVKQIPDTIPTFAVAIDAFLLFKLDEFSNDKHKAQWRATLEQYANPVIGNLALDQIKTDHVLSVLQPIWASKTETATRLRGRIESILSWAQVKGYRSGPNPAVWHGNLSELLPKPSALKNKRHHPALAVRDAQRWWHELKARDGTGAEALRFLSLSLNRSGEVRAMTWDEIQIYDTAETVKRQYSGVWTIPSHKMKAKREHRVPLTLPMVEIINRQHRGDPSDIVFKAARGGMLSDMTLSALMKRMHEKHFSAGSGFIDTKSKRPAVPHGLRSTFRDWVAENEQSREAAELQLAHQFGSAVEHAYYRSDLLDQRARLLDNWFNFLERK